MERLSSALDLLYEFKELRDKAKDLREQSRLALKGILGVAPNGKIEFTEPHCKKCEQQWIASGDEVETALLVKVQNHRDLSVDDETNDNAEASIELKCRLYDTRLEELFSGFSDAPNTGEHAEVTVPVLVAARVMQSLVRRAETVFSRATMICYYRIIRELHDAAGPDWTIGSASAGTGANTSAFVTGECIKAILAFDKAIRRTVDFFKKTSKLSQNYHQIVRMLDDLEVAPGSDHPLTVWAEQATERMWLDWYISTNPRLGEIALHYNHTKQEDRLLAFGEMNELLPDPPQRINIVSVGGFISGLGKKLFAAVDQAHKGMLQARTEIHQFRDTEEPLKVGEAKDSEGNIRKGRRFQETETAHQLGFRIVDRGINEASRAVEFLNLCVTTRDPEEYERSLAKAFREFVDQFETISRRIHRVLEPAKIYVRNVVNRELANHKTGGEFDAGELAFAAASFGFTTNWKRSDHLKSACELLIEALPDSGSLPTKRPFHSNTRGYRLLPIGCEMTRSFAQLLQKAGFNYEPRLVRRMLTIFEEKLILLRHSGHEKDLVAWNFEGAPDPDRPCLWVTAVGVLALDRIVRMLNERMNAIVLENFEVIKPAKPHTALRLNDLLYPDCGFNHYYLSLPSVAIYLEQMRAHVLRATLPPCYRKKVRSLILYGHPGTGKTTFVESLALSCDVPLVRVSPSDLTIQGKELMEGRARLVFEALSMLTQTVVILDEFDSVFTQRDSSKQRDSNKEAARLLTGMLPKLINLNDEADKQSFAYCLATNHIEGIDQAAKREGRFDYQLPIYNPDPLSRAGTFLLKLEQFKDKEHHGSPASGKDIRVRRLLNEIASTAYVKVNELGDIYYTYRRDPGCFDYYMGKTNSPLTERRKAERPGGTKKKKPAPDENESKIMGWEDHLNSNREKISATDLLVLCLTPPKVNSSED